MQACRNHINIISLPYPCSFEWNDKNESDLIVYIEQRSLNRSISVFSILHRKIEYVSIFIRKLFGLENFYWRNLDFFSTACVTDWIKSLVSTKVWFLKAHKNCLSKRLYDQQPKLAFSIILITALLFARHCILAHASFFWSQTSQLTLIVFSHWINTKAFLYEFNKLVRLKM